MIEEGDEVETFGEHDELETADLPWSAYPDWLVLSDVSDLAFRIYSLLRSFGDKSRGGRQSFPGQRKLATLRGYSKTREVREAIRELEAIGAVSRTPITTRYGRATRYTTYFPNPRPGYERMAWLNRTGQLADPAVMERLHEERVVPKQRPPRGKEAM